MKNKMMITLAIGTLFSFSALAGDAVKGKAKAATCIACHGAKGISMIPNYPNLAGQKEQYMLMQLKAFKNGTRKNPIMSPMATMLSDDDMANVSAYYASLDPSGK